MSRDEISWSGRLSRLMAESRDVSDAELCKAHSKYLLQGCPKITYFLEFIKILLKVKKIFIEPKIGDVKIFPIKSLKFYAHPYVSTRTDVLFRCQAKKSKPLR